MFCVGWNDCMFCSCLTNSKFCCIALRIKGIISQSYISDVVFRGLKSVVRRAYSKTRST